jgi:hypothetical protein
MQLVPLIDQRVCALIVAPKKGNAIALAGEVEAVQSDV